MCASFDEKCAVLGKNFAEELKKLNSEREIMSSYLFDLANVILAAVKQDVEGGGVSVPEALRSRLSYFDELNVDYDPIDANRKYIDLCLIREFQNLDVRLCECIFELSGKYLGHRAFLDDIIVPETEGLPKRAYGKVSYVKNLYADLAYEKFSSFISSPRAMYQSNFAAVCEDVYSGECEFGLLPAENSGEGKLNSFYNLIDRYDLKITKACTVPTADGINETKFVMLRKNIEYPDVEGTLSVELRFSPDDEVTLERLSFALGYFGAVPIRSDSVHRSYIDDSYNYDIIFECKKEQLDIIALFLLLHDVQFSILGIYTYLKG